LQGRYPHQRGFAFETQADRLIAARALRAVGVFELVHRRLDEVSGGEAQRALIASAIAQEADYLLLDEPTSGLDLHHGVQILDI
ncbi:MAG: ABC transporter ATP-binding protein, partial [Deltaproteobacteria bacterium CG17_big_fil_post_rev_8_21_14_2_50_63_7]